MIFFRKHKCVFCEEKVDHEKAAMLQFNVIDTPEVQQRYVCDECVKIITEQSIDNDTVRLLNSDLDDEGKSTT